MDTSENSPEELRQSLANRIEAAFVVDKPTWLQSLDAREQIFRRWAEDYSPRFAEVAKPLIYHQHPSDIPFDTLRLIEALKPGIWWNPYLNETGYDYMLPIYLRGILLAPTELDVAFEHWVDHLLPFDLSSDEISVSYEIRVSESVLKENLKDRSTRLKDYAPQVREFIAEYFENFRAMYPHEMLSRQPKSLQLAEQFWRGIYLT